MKTLIAKIAALNISWLVAIVAMTFAIMPQLGLNPDDVHFSWGVFVMNTWQDTVIGYVVYAVVAFATLPLYLVIQKKFVLV